ncbi:HAD family hydrolase [Halococcus saccharolyticus]|uniref:HAD family hydrolase n=1 Tax=Halococcus saccharolyticus TaxID=62319 RepID=UPI0006779D77|nr:HAD family hydrolase [Halococcus saccharolyticus]
MTTPPISTVCFDLDGTLLTYNQNPDAVLATAFDDAGVEQFCDPTQLWAAADDVDDADDDIDFLTKTFRAAGERHDGATDSPDVLAQAYDDATDHTDVSFRPGAQTALERAREHGRVGLITNGGRATQRQKLDALDIHDAFEIHVYAGEMTPPKPATEPFERATTALDADPERTLYVGNSLRHDVAGARAAGLQAAWFPVEGDGGDHDGHDPHHVFDSLHDLGDVL